MLEAATPWSGVACVSEMLTDHGVDDIFELDHDGTLDSDGNLLCQVSGCDGLGM